MGVSFREGGYIETLSERAEWWWQGLGDMTHSWEGEANERGRRNRSIGMT